MSTAYNHMKRSHRSAYRSRSFTGSRKAVIKPTLSRDKQMQIMNMFRKFFKNRREKKNDTVSD